MKGACRCREVGSWHLSGGGDEASELARSMSMAQIHNTGPSYCPMLRASPFVVGLSVLRLLLSVMRAFDCTLEYGN